ITTYHPPPYTPDLNPAEDTRPVPHRTTQANTTFTDPDHLIRQLRHDLHKIQNHSPTNDECLTETGLTPTTPRLQPQ
ncbi:IS630 family transposase, partial [Streptomyces goshikiensis]